MFLSVANLKSSAGIALLLGRNYHNMNEKWKIIHIRFCEDVQGSNTDYSDVDSYWDYRASLG